MLIKLSFISGLEVLLNFKLIRHMISQIICSRFDITDIFTISTSMLDGIPKNIRNTLKKDGFVKKNIVRSRKLKKISNKQKTCSDILRNKTNFSFGK